MLNRFAKYLFRLFLFSHPLNGMTQEYVMRNYDVRDGLPSSEVHDIYEDQKGYMWFATDRGIVRFDGLNFILQEDKRVLQEMVILNFFEESEHKVWFSDLANHLYFFDPLALNFSIQPYKYNDSLTSAFGSITDYPEFIRQYWVDDSLNVYITFLHGFGQIVLDKKGDWRTIDRDYDPYDFSVSQNYGHFDIEIQYYPDENKFHPVSVLKYSEVDPLEIVVFNQKNNKKVDTKQRFILETHWNGGISFSLQNDDDCLFSMDKFLFLCSNDSVNSIKLHSKILTMEIVDDDIWIATYSGLQVYSYPDFKQKKQLLLPKYTITGIDQDRSGGIWISTSQKGVFYISNPEMGMWPTSGMESLIFKDLIVREHFMLGGTEDAIYTFDKRFDVGQYMEGVYSRDGIYTTNKDERMSQYLGPPLIVNHAYRDDFPYFSILSLDQQEHYLAYNNLLSKIQGRNQNDTILVIPRMTDVVKVDSNLFYITTIEGLFQMKDVEISRFDHPNPLLKSNLRRIEPLLGGYLMASYGNGLIYMKGGKVYKLDKEDGLSSSSISSFIIEGDSVIWLMSYGGVDRISWNAELNEFKINQINEGHGLVSDEVIAADLYNDTLWISTKEGINFLKTLSWTPTELFLADLFHVDSIYKNQKKADLQDTLTIIENEQLELYFTQLCYAAPSEIDYDYRVKELGSEWRLANGGYLVVPNLSAGEYTLQIRPRYRQEVGQMHTIFISVQLPIWKSAWAYALYVVVAFLVIALTFRLLLNRLDKRRKQELEKVQLELKALIAQMNPHFTFNTINSIQHFLVTEDKKAALSYLADFAMLMRRTLDYSRREFITLQEEIDFLTLYVSLENKRFDQPIDFTVKLDLSIPVDRLAVPGLLLQPLIENAIVHGLQGLDYRGGIVLSVKETAAYYEFVISDNGKGISKAPLQPQSNKRKSHGLEILKSRLQLYNPDKKVEEYFEVVSSTNSEGTFVRVRLFKPITILDQ